MYLPAHFEVTDTAVLHDVIVTYPLGTWIVSDGAQLIINHVPFLFDSTVGAHGVLQGHVARANPVWKQLAVHINTAVVFHAEQGYISPSWYPGKQLDPGVVPTWNYAVVHVHGKSRAIEDKVWLRQHVIAHTDRHEKHRDHPWHVSDVPEDYIEKRLAGIVGVEIEIESIQGKFKLSQNRTSADQDGVVAGLHASGEEQAASLARRMQQDRK